MNYSAFHRRSQTPVRSADYALMKLRTTFLQSTPCSFKGRNMRSHQHDCKQRSYVIPPDRWLPIFARTQSLYNNFIRQSSGVGLYPRRSPLGGSLSPTNAYLSFPSTLSSCVSYLLSGSPSLSSLVLPPPSCT